MKRITFLLLLSSGFYSILQAQNVGIGTTTPTYPLTVQSGTGGKGIVQKNGTAEVGFYNDGSATFLQTWTAHDLNFATNNGGARITIATSTGYVGINNASPAAQMDINGTLRIRGNGAGAGKVLTSDANGNATWQAPATGSGIGFSAYLSANLPLADGVTTNITGYTEDFDDGNVFTPANGRFTAPSAGVYEISYNLNFLESGTATKYLNIDINLNGGATKTYYYVISGLNSNAGATYTNSLILKLAQGDYISLAVTRSQSGGSTLRGGFFTGSTYFSVHKVY